MKIMKINKSNIYDTFRCPSQGKKETLNDILKGTKIVLSNEKGFKNYMTNYSMFTTKKSFKFPDKNDYPLFKVNSSFLLPIKKVKNTSQEDMLFKKRLKLKRKITLSKEFFLNNNTNYTNTYREKFNKRYYQLLSLKNEEKQLKKMQKNHNDAKAKRYNTLFLDFFDKWYKKNNAPISNFSERKNKKHFLNENRKEKKEENNANDDNFFNFNVKERYSGLYYNENEIFNTNYDKFILERINYIKKNKIKNYQLKIESSFYDLNQKLIKLKLESIKIKFYPQNKNENNIKDKFNIYLPLSFVFLFYINDINFIERILMNILYFEKDFNMINFNDDNLYELLNNPIKKAQIIEEEDNNDNENIFSKTKRVKKNFTQNFNNIKDMIFKKETYDKKSLIKNSTKTFPQIIKVRNNNEQKIKLIHSCYNYKQRYEDIYPEDKFDKEIDNIVKYSNSSINNYFNQYYFIWETPDISYKIKIEMPKIFFSYEDFDYNIVSYCDKNLFLYLYKNNFINWDFYILNYIFSIKSFRKILLAFLSFSKEYSLISNSIINKKQIKNLKSSSILNNLEYLLNNRKDKEEINNKNIFLTDKKIYNQMNENNESYSFLYTDANFKNYIINFHSYHIKIEYRLLNPRLKWEFCLNFKQMRQLNEISKYVSLNSFLPKIVKTNFEYGSLDIDFSILDENFNVRILQKDKDVNPNTETINVPNNEMEIEINKPCKKKKKIFDDIKTLTKQELDYSFLQNINELKIDTWSKKLLDVLEMKKEFQELKVKDSPRIKSYRNKFTLQDITKLKRNSKQKLTYFANKTYKIDNYMPDLLKKIKSHEN